MDIPWVNFGILEYAYELRTPNPLTMSSGRYTGTLTYSMGPYSEVDFGDAMVS